MSVRNSELIDPERGVYSVLGLVAFSLPGPYLWQDSGIDDEMAQGSYFGAYESKDPKEGSLDVASITVVDATNDPTEPDVSTLVPADIQSIDDFLRESTQSQLPAQGMKLISWMPSQLNQSDNFKGLITAYIVEDQGKERQFFALRFKAKGRKVVAIGVFDIAKKEVLAVPIFNVIRNMVVLE